MRKSVEEVTVSHDDMVLDLVNELGDMKVDPNNLPHIASVLENLMRAFGGVEGFSRHVALNYLAAKPGSLTRNKMLQSIMSMAVKVSESGAAKVPLELLDDSDIEREIEKRARRLRIVDAG